MLTINQIRENKDEVIRLLKIKNFDASSIIEQILQIDLERRNLRQSLDNLQAEMNKTSEMIGKLFKEGKASEANLAKEKTGQIKEEIRLKNEAFSKAESDQHALLVLLPNTPNPSIVPGKSAADNEHIREGGKMITPNPSMIPHWDLAKKYDLIDFELGNKLTGSGFPVYKGKCAVLQRALISFFLDEATEAGYNEVMVPLMVNEDSGFGTGQLPDKEGQMYHATADNLYLIPTAEVPVTNMYRDVILNESDFPVRNTAYTPCFRREAGSYGKDVRGLNRLHQFDKVEIVRIEKPENSYQALEEMVSYVESLVQKLELPYRIIRLCGGDMSFTSAMTYDFEVFSAAQDKWLEVSSVSNFESYQANRLMLRYKPTGEKKTRLAHTLNGSALALPRIVAAILENNQTENGIKIPECLVKYTKFDFIN